MNPNDITPIRFTPKKEGSSFIDDVKTRPAGQPKARSDFKRVLARDPEQSKNSNKSKIVDDEDDDDLIATSDNEIKPVKKASSLFDLSSGRDASEDLTRQRGLINRKQDETTFNGDMPVDSSTTALADPQGANKLRRTHESPSALSSRRSFIEEAHGDFIPPSSDTKEKVNTRFVNEQTDLSYVNPLATVQNIPSSASLQTEAKQASLLPSHIQAIISQLVDKVQEMKMDGRTDTTVTLKHPPLFAGVNLIVTAYDNARGEFNISFENLTQAAKAVLDMQANRDTLLASLEQKGYAVHIVTTTTLVENRPIDIPTHDARFSREQREGEGQQQRDRKNREEEETG